MWNVDSATCRYSILFCTLVDRHSLCVAPLQQLHRGPRYGVPSPTSRGSHDPGMGSFFCQLLASFLNPSLPLSDSTRYSLLASGREAYIFDNCLSRVFGSLFLSNWHMDWVRESFLDWIEVMHFQHNFYLLLSSALELSLELDQFLY